MASEPEKTSESESKIVDAEKQDLNNEEKNEENIDIEVTSTNLEQQSKQPKPCEEDPYIVKLFKNLMKLESQQSLTEKKK